MYCETQRQIVKAYAKEIEVKPYIGKFYVLCAKREQVKVVNPQKRKNM